MYFTSQRSYGFAAMVRWSKDHVIHTPEHMLDSKDAALVSSPVEHNHEATMQHCVSCTTRTHATNTTTITAKYISHQDTHTVAYVSVRICGETCTSESSTQVYSLVRSSAAAHLLCVSLYLFHWFEQQLGCSLQQLADINFGVCGLQGYYQGHHAVNILQYSSLHGLATCIDRKAMRRCYDSPEKLRQGLDHWNPHMRTVQNMLTALQVVLNSDT